MKKITNALPLVLSAALSLVIVFITCFCGDVEATVAQVSSQNVTGNIPLKESFKKEFYRADLGVFVDAKGTDHSAVHSNILPLYFALTDEENEEKIVNYLISRGNCTGVYMSYFLLKALCRVGRYDAALSIITSESETSWYNMIREGGTTCFEAWGKDQKWNTSLCHPWASAPISVIIKDIVPNIPGIAKIIYKDK